MSQDEVKEVLRPYFKELCPNCSGVSLTYPPLKKITDSPVPTKVYIAFSTTEELAKGHPLLEQKIKSLHDQPVTITKFHSTMLSIQNNPIIIGKFYQDALRLKTERRDWEIAMLTFLMGSHPKNPESTVNLFLFKHPLFDKNLLRLIYDLGPTPNINLR